jgi:MFS transporter, DHA1 family, L-arabinose/isopropyl-beta-D-thiogalactopyranoside export protein
VLLLPFAHSHILTIAVCAVWGISVTAYNIAMQSEVIAASSEDESAVAMSIYSGIFNLGIGTGALAGGAVTTHLSLSLIGFAGAVLAVAGILYWLLRLKNIMF